MGMARLMMTDDVRVMFVLRCGDMPATAQRAATYGRPEMGSSAAELRSAQLLTGH
jgi:hypothetical protein